MHTRFAAATEFSCVFRTADTSSYSIEERLMASVWVHERQHTGQTMSKVMAAFRERFNEAPPRRATLLDWEKRAFALGSVKDRPRSGRKTARLETSAAVAASIECSSMKSTRKRSSELGVPRSAVRDHMKRDLNVRPYCPTVRWRHGSALRIMPCSAGHILKCRIPLKGSFQWRMCHLSQCARQKCGVLVKAESQFQAGDGT